MSETRNGNILVVDDTPQTLQLLVAILSGANYTVRPADSGALALAWFLAACVRGCWAFALMGAPCPRQCS